MLTTRSRGSVTFYCRNCVTFMNEIYFIANLTACDLGRTVTTVDNIQNAGFHIRNLALLFRYFYCWLLSRNFKKLPPSSYLKQYSLEKGKEKITADYKWLRKFEKFRYLRTTVINQMCIHEEIKGKLNYGNACYRADQIFCLRVCYLKP
jgi:hypothetical protein